MGIFSRSANEGIMDVIRCDLPTYLVWKWKPNNGEGYMTKRENAIRWGSSLRVKEGEMAIFVYGGADGSNYDTIVGPFDKILKPANLPVLANILGLAYNGASPFQAEVYFINLANNIQILFGVPYFDVFDPRYPDLPVPVSVRGTLTFNISDYKTFIANNRLIDFTPDDLKKQIKNAVIKYVKNVVIPLPQQEGFPLMQIESKVLDINERIEHYMKPRFHDDFGISLRAFDIEAIEINKNTESYKKLQQLTIGIKYDTTMAQSELNIQNMRDTQELNKENVRETMRIQREEMQRAQRLQTETQFIGAHALNRQADVMEIASESLGHMNSNIGGGSSGSVNPAGLMTGMMMGGAIGHQMAGMFNQMGQNMNTTFHQTVNTPPPIPNISFYVLIANQQQGPLNIQQLKDMVTSGMLTPDTYVWKEGMINWDHAKNTELQRLFCTSPTPPVPPIPPVPPTI